MYYKSINVKVAVALIEQKNSAGGEIPNYVGCALVLLERLLVKVKEEREETNILRRQLRFPENAQYLTFLRAEKRFRSRLRT